jgi:hypothetical protein
VVPTVPNGEALGEASGEASSEDSAAVESGATAG